ncbi:MAG: preprotein translocase subunit SecA [bacterium]|nr:preprotein translocase subunit SecA [bacterium]
MLSFFKKFIGSGPDFTPIVEAINVLEPEMEKLSNDELKAKSAEFKERVKNGESLDNILGEAFALVREAGKRTLGQRHFDVQLIGGIALHRGTIAEMMTGEGKTLAATTAVYLNALTGKGAHVVTVNEYLAKRDAVWMGQIYNALGLTVGCLVHEGAVIYDPSFKSVVSESALLDKERDTTGSFLVQTEYLRPVKRREAYAADITYGTNHEFGFDYLRDNMAYKLEDKVQRNLYYAVIDEVDSVLIDEARTPLIISTPDVESSDYYKVFARVSDKLIAGEDYEVDEKMRSVSILDAGIDKVEKILGIKDFYAPDNIRMVHYLEESLKARAIFKRDKDYVVKDNEIIIVDQFTGRMMLGRRYSGGLHQALEAKEGVLIKEESRTYAKISIQNYFRLYEKIGGMTGTAQTSAEEFHKVYELDVISIPSNRPVVRVDHSDVIYKTRRSKYEAVAARAKECVAKGQPVLIGTASIENNEVISTFLSQAGIKHEVLNAKNHEREGAIIAQAGRAGSVTVATNMAGRGVDIILGGNPPNKEDGNKVKDAGGLMVFGTERHEARRIDNQLRGRTGRQGDPGESLFFLSLEDDLLRIFGGERIQGLMETLKAPEDMPLESSLLSRLVSQSQAKVEGFNFDARKHMLEYDDVLNKQRTDFYNKRTRLLSCIEKDELKKYVDDFVYEAADKAIVTMSMPEQIEMEGSENPPLTAIHKLTHFFVESGVVKDQTKLQTIIKENEGSYSDEIPEAIKEFIHEEINARMGEIVSNDTGVIMRLLSILDMLWMTHLENMEALQESVRLRAYAQHDPLVEFRRESYNLYKDFFAQFGMWLLTNLFRGAPQQGSVVQAIRMQSPQQSSEFKNVGRNDPCPCGAKHEDGRPKKYKHCHGK